MFSRVLAVPVVATGPFSAGMEALDDASIGTRTPVRANNVTPLSPAAGVRTEIVAPAWKYGSCRSTGGSEQSLLLATPRAQRISNGVAVLPLGVHAEKGAPPDNNNAASNILRWASGSRATRTTSASILAPWQNDAGLRIVFGGHFRRSLKCRAISQPINPVQNVWNPTLCGFFATPFASAAAWTMILKSLEMATALLDQLVRGGWRNHPIRALGGIG